MGRGEEAEKDDVFGLQAMFNKHPDSLYHGITSACRNKSKKVQCNAIATTDW